MWELCICTSNVEVAKYFYQTLKSEARQKEICVTCFEEFDNFYVLFACPLAEKEASKALIEKCVQKVVCENFKDAFLEENLRFPVQENLSKMAFKKALINFDKETDYFIISKNLQFENNLFLDSFYDFKLKTLRDKWAELISLANENCDYLTSPEAFFDLLRFLIDNLTVCEDEINVFKEEGGYVVKAEQSTHEHLSQEGLVCSLIDLCPKKINFFCHGDEVVTFLSQIFDERVFVESSRTFEKCLNFQK